jgi:hypothetical protein
MNKRLSFLIGLILIASFLVTNCGPVTRVPDAPPTPTLEPAPDVQVRADQVAPQVVEQVPPAGQRLRSSGSDRL